MCKTQAIKKIKFSLSLRTRFYFCRTTHKWFTEFSVGRRINTNVRYACCSSIAYAFAESRVRRNGKLSRVAFASAILDAAMVPPGRYIECVRQCSLQRSQCSIIPVHRVGVPVVAALSENKLLSTFIFQSI